MSAAGSIPVRVAAIETVSPFIKTFTLEPLDGGLLPAFSGGSHVVVTMQGRDRNHRNPYSLMSSPYERRFYQISVRREDDGRGGSKFLHGNVRVGDELAVSPPANLFALNELGRRHILIAGGIGITPFLSQLYELRAQGSDYALHYAYRRADDTAFLDRLAAEHGERAHCYESSQGHYVEPGRILADQPLGTHVYVCGPEGLIDTVVTRARRLGWPESHIHAEEFAAPPSGKPFTVVLDKSGDELEIGPDDTVLDVLEDNGYAPDCSCRGGVCGECETAVIAGEIEHHDDYLSEEVKREHSRMMICVSRAASERVVLDL